MINRIAVFRAVIGQGEGHGSYTVALGNSNSWDITGQLGLTEKEAPQAAWYYVVDAIEEYPRFRRIELTVEGHKLNLGITGGRIGAQIQIQICAAIVSR